MKLRLQVSLMLLTILGVAGFQLFWLKQNYAQEKKTLSIKTDFIFRDVVQQLQVSTLNLDSLAIDTMAEDKIKLRGDSGIRNEIFTVDLNQKKGVVSTINIIRKRISDSAHGKGVFIARDQTLIGRDINLQDMSKRNLLMRVLSGVDSLHDSLKIKDITASMKKRMIKENINIPFTILKVDSTYTSGDLINLVTVGFNHPSTYLLKPGNEFPYLIKRISLPVLFSILLFGIMIISFFLLHRNLLQQKRLTAIKNEFIGNITHELKTPIATVSVAIEAMKNFDALQSPERTREYLEISANELQRLSLLVDKVLNLSKFEKNEMEIKKEPFDLVQLIRDVMGSMKLQFEKQHAVTTLQITGTNFIMKADPRHISSVVYNLLDNALKYSREDPRIIIEVIDQEKFLEIRVSDNGIGIPAEYNRKIFEQFFRVPSGDMHNTKGYGLGLSYVNYIVTSHQGFIEVESELGKGSTFVVKLPFAEADVIYYDRDRKIIKKGFKLWA